MSVLRFSWLRKTLLALLCVIVAGVVATQTLFAQSSGDFEAFKEDIEFLKGEVTAVLLFSPFGSANANFLKHKLSSAQIDALCGSSSSCGNLGVNFGTYFKSSGDYTSANKHGMKWVLEIGRGPTADKPNGDFQAVVDTIKGNTDKTVVVRIGTRDTAGGFGGYKENAEDYIRFLRSISDASGGAKFVAIAGPNEPDLEMWFSNNECTAAPGTATAESEEFYNCVGPKLASYMNAVCNAGLPDNVILTTPAFNMSSYTFPGIVKAMNDAGAEWGCIAASGGGQGGFAGNLYPAGKSMREYWTDDSTGAAINALKSYGLSNIYITETGPLTSLNDEDDTGGTADDAAIADDDFYVHPIKGFAPEANVDEIRNDLVRQGYEVQCAAPRFFITLDMGGREAMEALLKPENKPEGVVLGGSGAGISNGVGDYIKSKMTVDFRESLVPVFRDLEPPPQLKRSLEDYFGYREADNSSFNGTELKSAAINSLLSRHQRCAQSVASLRARKEMCDKLENPDECALYKAEIPGSTYNPKTLLEYYETVLNSQYPGMTDFEACQDITGSGTRDVIEIRDALLATPLEISKSYRIAFLVTSIRLNLPSRSSLFTLFTHPRAGLIDGPSKPKTAVVVTAFKVPDITTNKGTIEGEPESGSTPFNDPAILTRDTLIPKAIRDKFNSDGSDERKLLFEEAARQGQIGQDVNGSEIFCLEDNGAPGGTDGIGSCTDPLTKALVDIINAQKVLDKESVECSGDTYLEKNETLFDSGSLQPLSHPSRIFKADFGAALLKSLFTDIDYHNPGDGYDPGYGDTGEDNWNLKSVYHVTPQTQATGFPYNPDEDDREVKHFIVYPAGYDQKTIETVLAGSFFSTEQLTALQEEAEQKLLLQMQNTVPEFEGGSASYSFTDNTDCEEEEYVDASGIERTRRVCKVKSFSFGLSLKNIPVDMGVLGARLGYWMYNVQKSLFKAASLPHQYLQACETVEQFLLDRCGAPDSAAEVTTEVAYCDGSAFVAIKNISNANLDRFTFFTDNDPENTIAASEFFPSGNDKSCSFSADVRIIDGLTLILSDGKDVVGNNPGNGPCGGVTDISEALEIKRLPPEGPLPEYNDSRWQNAPTMRSKGTAVSRATYNLKLKPGYYRVGVYRNSKNGVCISNQTEVVGNGTSGGEQYVFDLSGTKCSQRACVAMNLQPAMEGGDEDETEDDVGNCQLSFEYEVYKYNNACGGGRAGDCEDEGGCDFWGDFIDDLNSGSIYQSGYALYKTIFGRSLTNHGDEMACTSGSGNNNAIFANTLNVGDCAAVDSDSNPIDSISVFDKLVSFTLTYWDGTDIEFPIPSRDLWNNIQTASDKHGCDPLLVLATAQALNRDYTNQTIPDENGALGIFQITPYFWEKWQIENQPGGKGNANGKYGSCDFWQPSSFSRSGMDFSSPTNIREAVDTTCRRILWSGAQAEVNDRAAFINKLTSKGANPETGSKAEKFLSGDSYRAGYIFDLWAKLREEVGLTAKAQPSGYPYASCTGDPPAKTNSGNINYDEPTQLPATGVATYYSEGVMNLTLKTRETTLDEIPPEFIDSCEFNIPGTDYSQIFEELNRKAASNGTSKVVGCAALLRYGDVKFRQTRSADDIRLVWIKRPDGAPNSIPEVIGPIAVIDVAAIGDRDTIYDNHGGQWLIDLDFNTFKRLFAWKGGWEKPQYGVTVCDTREQCQ